MAKELLKEGETSKTEDSVQGTDLYKDLNSISLGDDSIKPNSNNNHNHNENDYPLSDNDDDDDDLIIEMPEKCEYSILSPLNLTNLSNCNCI